MERKSIKSAYSSRFPKERTAALIKQARDLTAQLKAETEEIKTHMETVVDGPDDRLDEGGEAGLDATILAEVAAKRTLWWRWR